MEEKVVEENLQQQQQVIQKVILFAVLFFGGWYGFNWWIHHKVASDAVQQYEMVKRNGSPTDLCHQAQMVSAAYLQAKDEQEYQKWKGIEKDDCIAAGRF